VRVEQFQSGTCALLNLIPLVLIIVILVLIAGAIMMILSGEVDIAILTGMGISLIIMAIILIIISALMPGLCLV
jgi:uncharacterized membrane protein